MADYKSIKSWSEEDRPREKLLLKGREALSDSELIAILIGSGSREKSAVELSREILHDASDNLHKMARWDISDFMKYKGIGEAKAISIVAALELGRRKTISEPLKQKQINSSYEAYKVMAPQLSDLNHEEFWILLLNSNNRIMTRERISSGGVSATVVDPRIILKKAINVFASSILLFHNHPSGNLKPSRADISLTNKLKAACKHLDMKLHDHIIIAQEGYYSFQDEDML